MQTRHDLLDDIGLYRTTARVRNSTDRVDDVYQGSLGIYASANHVINDWFRLQPGLRTDGFHFDVESDDALHAGKENAAIVSPKLNLIFGPWAETELYASAGMGFHSNDARGVNMAVDAADPLVRTYGYELGVRTEALDRVVSTLALFYLHSDSEILYVGDAGTAEAGPATDRYGIEWTTYWRPNDWMMFDHELTLSEAKLLNEPAGNEIPGSVPITMSSGFVIGKDEGLFTSVRSRFFDARPLTEDGSVESRVSWQVNGRLGYRKNDWELALDVLNILGRDDNDIEYFYESQLAGEPTGVEGVHLHPTEPRTFRVSLTKRF